MKAHIGVVGNEFADEMVKLGCGRGNAPVVTEGGVRAAEPSAVGCAKGRVAG